MSKKVKVLDGGGGLNKFLGVKNDILKNMSKNVKVLDGGGGLNKFLGPKNYIKKIYVIFMRND